MTFFFPVIFPLYPFCTSLEGPRSGWSTHKKMEVRNSGAFWWKIIKRHPQDYLIIFESLNCFFLPKKTLQEGIIINIFREKLNFLIIKFSKIEIFPWFSPVICFPLRCLLQQKRDHLLHAAPHSVKVWKLYPRIFEGIAVIWTVNFCSLPHAICWHPSAF